MIINKLMNSITSKRNITLLKSNKAIKLVKNFLRLAFLFILFVSLLLIIPVNNYGCQIILFSIKYLLYHLHINKKQCF